MNNFTYEWKPQCGFAKKADPNKVAAEINGLGDSILPESIVEKGKDESTELHKCFEWDDTEAAKMYRIKQARQIVEGLHIVILDKPETVEIQKPRVFYHITGSPGYTPTLKILSDEDKRLRLLEQAKAELKAFKVKYAMLTELQNIFDLIE